MDLNFCGIGSRSLLTKEAGSGLSEFGSTIENRRQNVISLNQPRKPNQDTCIDACLTGDVTHR